MQTCRGVIWRSPRSTTPCSQHGLCRGCVNPGRRSPGEDGGEMGEQVPFFIRKGYNGTSPPVEPDL